MTQILLPGTSIRVSRLVFGTASLHHLSGSQQSSLLVAAAEAGITHFDTAPYYGFGLAETALGQLLASRPELTVTTKVGLYPPPLRTGSRAEVMGRKALGRLAPRLARPVADFDVRRARESLEASRSRLRRDRIDLLLLHEPDVRGIDGEAWLTWLLEEKDKGRISAFGLAGETRAVAPFVDARHSIAQVVQTRDSVTTKEADFLLAAGRPLQLTFGYLADRSHQDPAGLLGRALSRNATGAVVVSTRRVARIETFARAMDDGRSPAAATAGRT